MNEGSATATDRRTDEWLQEGPSTAPGYLLEATLERTSRSPQRSRLVALLMGAPSDGVRGAPRERLLILIAVLAGSMIVAGALIAGSLRHTDELSLLPSPSASGRNVSPAPTSSGRPGPGPLTGLTRTFLIRGGGAAFRAIVPSTWSMGRDGSVRFVTRAEIGHTFDLVPKQFLAVTLQGTSFEAERSGVLAGRSNAAVIEFDVAGQRAVIVGPSESTNGLPFGLMAGPGAVYRFDMTTASAPYGDESTLLRAFMAGVDPLGPAANLPGTFVAPGGSWQFVPAVAGGGWLNPRVEAGQIVIPSAGCPNLGGPDCVGTISVREVAAGAPFVIQLPDGGTAELPSTTFVDLAAAWDRTVGRAFGSETDEWDGTLSFLVNNQAIAGRFFIRDGRSMAVVATTRSSDPHSDAPSLLSGFDEGFDLLP